VIRGTRVGELSVPAECFVTIRLYFDEDSMDRDLTKALQARGVDVATALDAGMLEHEDEEQLDYAIAQGRVLYGFNIGDFHRLHTILFGRGQVTWVSSCHGNNITP